MKAMEELRKKASERAFELSREKENGTKIVEYIGNFVPEELIHASGAKPYLNCRGGEPESPDAVLEDVLRYTNPLARSQVGFYKLGLDPITPIADLIAVNHYECHQARMCEYMEVLNLPVFKLGVPDDWTRDFAQEYYYDQLVLFKEKLEELTGKKITNEEILNSIKLYNKMNELLGKISDLRRDNNSPITGTEFIKLNHYTFMTDPEYAVEKLEEIYEELKTAPAKFSKDAPRILVIGHGVAIGDYIVLGRLEELGAMVSYEFLEEGIRWYQWPVSESEADPIRAIQRQRYLDKPPMDNFEPAWATRIEYYEQLIKDNQIDGVLWYQLLYDEIWDLEYSCVAKRMAELDVPILRIETSYEYTREAMLPLNTRLESYIALLKNKKRGIK